MHVHEKARKTHEKKKKHLKGVKGKKKLGGEIRRNKSKIEGNLSKSANL